MKLHEFDDNKSANSLLDIACYSPLRGLSLHLFYGVAGATSVAQDRRGVELQ